MLLLDCPMFHLPILRTTDLISKSMAVPLPKLSFHLNKEFIEFNWIQILMLFYINT